MDLTIVRPTLWRRLLARTRPRALGASALIAVGSIAPALQQCDPPPPPPPSQQQQVVDVTNQRRAEAGLAPLQANGLLDRAAQDHSQDQANRAKMTHTGSDGSNAGQRITRAGYRWRAWGENVAYGQADAVAVMDAWMRSSGHRANILNGNFTEIGVGLAYSSAGRPYWTMVLARPG